ncbi:HesB/IscA family protein [Lyticum sinuosum]|uniref:Iron-sulfur cluster insertion protein ErpA n=1 Tax=Lyticum sinuosum TaxID=1332059 RepID=A0AAE4VLW7_9RICK|nr:iron-sulfur cluster assembly accessory protein [Lyticum sinuosum]MDZ5761068.1 Iron-sulfur cluster insertion protein ErpA [Lyticum sinuosum]
MSDIIFNITDKAWSKISQIISQNPSKIFRIEILGGGCSGFKYNFIISNSYSIENDYIFYQNRNFNDEEKDSEKSILVIDKLSFEFIKGSKLDHISNLEGEYFDITNPNANAKCGCGSSFSI